MGWPAVRGFRTGDQIIPEILNAPINQLVERTEDLKNRLSRGGSPRVVIDVTVPDDGVTGHPNVGQPVYRKADGTYSLASAQAQQDTWFYADPAAMAVGIVSSVSGTSATVCLFGLLEFVAKQVPVSSVVSDSEPESGRGYLSAVTGKITKDPSGPVIYLGDLRFAVADGVTYVSSILVSPQYRDTGESHVHRQFVLSGMPLGGYAVRAGASGSERFYAPGLVDTTTATSGRSSTALPSGITFEPCGRWVYTGVESIVYTLRVVRTRDTTTELADAVWTDYDITWTVSGGDTGGRAQVSLTDPVVIGAWGLKVWFRPASGVTPSSSAVSGLADLQWSVTMPDAARAWINYTHTEGSASYQGFRLNLGMYSALARYVPAVPENTASLSVGGVEMRGPVFPMARREWFFLPATEKEGGPWLVWIGGDAPNAASATAPFNYAETFPANGTNATDRNIVLCVSRLRVGPEGYVTSLQVAKGSPLKITSAQTDADAVQGALQIGMDVDFTSSDRNISGHTVVKRINGSTFELGPVVERIVAGPGIAALPDGGQGTVTLSVSNAAFAGDFETIALRNAKQDVAGGIFPYTKLLKWNTSGTNVESGFTAKFRVPDHLPYKDYNVIVSASVFGETGVTGSADETAAFFLKGVVLQDYACSVDAAASLTGSLSTSVANPTSPTEATRILVSFASGYTAFDPVLLHGFAGRTTAGQRQYDAALLLKQSGNTAFVVKPGYFVGLKIDRCGLLSGGGTTAYTGALGFLSLRWNLVEAQGGVA